MHPPAVAFYISGHGFGHASRQAAVISAVQVRRPDLRIEVRTLAPRWFFELDRQPRVQFQRVEGDTGVVQIDSLRVDPAESIERAWAFHKDLDSKADAEAHALQATGAVLVVGDIPPLAFAAAARAGVPAVAVANFTWDWIYESYRAQLADAPRLLDVMRTAYASAAAAWRLPMHGGFAAFASVTDVPFVARRSGRDPAAVRRALGLPSDRPLALVAFGRYGPGRLDWAALARMTGYGIVVAKTPDDPRVENAWHGTDSAICPVDATGLSAVGFRYEDLVAAVDVVVTKPGYGIIAECVANETAILYTSRGHFAEYEVLVAEMPRFTRCEFIDQQNLLAGCWAPHLDKLLAQPPPPEHPATTGAEVVADMIVDYVD